MGLDVIFQKNMDDVQWDDPIMADFPFKQKSRGFPRFGNPDDPEEQTGEGRDFFISEITGMHVFGSVSFRGRGYSHFAAEFLPHWFSTDLSPEMLKKQSESLEAWLNKRKNESGEREYRGESLEGLRDLSKLLKWAVSHGLGTYASY